MGEGDKVGGGIDARVRWRKRRREGRVSLSAMKTEDESAEGSEREIRRAGDKASGSGRGD